MVHTEFTTHFTLRRSINYIINLITPPPPQLFYDILETLAFYFTLCVLSV